MLAFDGPLWVGRDSADANPNHRIDGSVDNVTVYQRALSQSEMLALIGATGIAGSAPVVTVSPTNVNASVGQTAQFSVGVSGTASLSYQWQGRTLNGSGAFTNLVDGGNRWGSGTGSLSLTNVALTDALDVRVVVANVYGSATSTVAQLTVGAAWCWWRGSRLVRPTGWGRSA